MTGEMLLNEDMVISVNALEFICQKALCDYFEDRINPKERAGTLSEGLKITKTTQCPVYNFRKQQPKESIML